MDQQISRVLSEISKLTSKIDRIESNFNDIKLKLDYIYRELGTREGHELYRQLDELYNNYKSNDKKINDIVRDVAAIRRGIEYEDVHIKEIQQALALIYRNTDELEESLLGEDRQTK